MPAPAPAQHFLKLNCKVILRFQVNCLTLLRDIDSNIANGKKVCLFSAPDDWCNFILSSWKLILKFRYNSKRVVKYTSITKITLITMFYCVDKRMSVCTNTSLRNKTHMFI